MPRGGFSSFSGDPASGYFSAHMGNTEMGKDGKFSKGKKETYLIKIVYLTFMFTSASSKTSQTCSSEQIKV